MTATTLVSFDKFFTYTRASTATYIGRDRLIHTAAIDEPRFTHDPATGKSLGLLVEGQATNVISLDGYGSTRVNTIEMVGSPLPSIDARKVIITGSSAYSFSSNPSSGPNQVWTHSIYAKHLTGKFIRVGWYGGSGRAFDAISAWFDLEKGEITGTNGNVIDCGIDDAGNGWYRCWVSAETVRDGPMGNCVFFDQGTVVGNELIWGLSQIEEGSFPTSYIPTEGSQVTRAAEFVDQDDISGWFNPNEGSFFVDCVIEHTETSDVTLMVIDDGTTGQTNQIAIRTSNLGRTIRLTPRSAGVAVWDAGIGTIPNGERIAIAFSYGPHGYSVSLNGAPALSSPGALPEGLKRLRLGRRGSGVTTFTQGRYRKLTYYPRALSNAEMEALTS